MIRLRETILVAVIGAGSVLIPAQKTEAGLIDWLRCVLHPWRACDPCAPAVAAPTCPPLVQEGSYYNPCAPCPVTYVRRSYMEPRTRLATQTVLEPRPTYVRRRYWDPCSRCYRTSFETSTSYVRRRYCVPVTDYVERSYLEPVSAAPACPPATCPVGTPTYPVPGSATPSAAIDQTRPGAGGNSVRAQAPARYPTSYMVPGRRILHPYPADPGA